MATVYTDIGAVQAGLVNTLANQNDTNLQLGGVGWITALYTMVGDETTSTIIYIARLNAGTLVHPYGYAGSDGAATTLTVTIGDTDTQGGTVSADVDKYSTALNVAAAGTNVLFATAAQVMTPTAIVDDQCWLTASVASIGTPVAGKKIAFRVPIIGIK